MYLKRGDNVVVISGVGKGKDSGKVLKVLEDTNQVIVQGLNMRFKHMKRSQKNPQGGRVQKEAPIHASRVALVDPKTNEPTRVGFRYEGEGKERKKIRYSKKSGEPI